MGDSSDLADVERFLRSHAGKKKMEELRLWLRGLWIQDLSFAAEVEGVEVTVTFHNSDKHLVFLLPELSLTLLRDRFADAIECEYRKEFPGRSRPAEDET